MLNSCSYNNNVRMILNTAIDTSVATVLIDEAVAPYSNPPATASADKPAYFTLMDNPVNPTKVEIIRATGVSSPALGVVTLTGVTRGVDGTTAQSWSVGSVVVQALNKAVANPAAVHATYPESFAGLFGNTAATWEYVIETNVDGVVIRAAAGGLFIAAEGIQVTGIRCWSGLFTNVEVQNSLTTQATFYANGQSIMANLRLTAAAPPTAASPGTAGEIRVAGNFVYVCTATNTWRRAALSTW